MITGAPGVHGINGDCEIPSDAVGVAMNVTVANPTAQSNLRVFPADTGTPNASNLNWLAGQSPTPNKVDVKLSSDGNIKLFNFQGTVDVLADVVGYYTSSTLQEIEQRLVSLENGKPFAVSARGSTQNVTFESATFVSLDVAAPTDGHITVNSAAYVSAFSEVELQCSIASTNATPPEQDNGYLQVWDSPSAGQHRSQISGTRSFTVSSGEVLPLKLVCGRIGGPGTMQVSGAVLTAIFTPAPRPTDPWPLAN